MATNSESQQSVSLRLLKVAVVAVGYFAAAKLGLLMAIEDGQASPVWPPTGLALAAVLLWGYSVWPGIFLGAFLATVVAYTASGFPVSTSILTSCGIGAGNSLEAIVGVFLLRRFVASGDLFDRARDVFKFVALAAMLATTISATVGVTSICLGGIGQWANIGYLWWTWWVGDAVGALVVAPFLLIWLKQGSIRWEPRRLAEAGAVFALLMLVSMLAFGAPGRPISGLLHQLEYLTIPIIVWAAFRFGQRGATASVLLAGTIAIWWTVRGFGPFAMESSNESLLLLQVYLGVVAVTTLTLAGVLTERGQAEKELAEHRDQLEELVHDRTSELEQSNQRLQQEIAERKQAEEALQKEQRLLRKWLDLQERERKLISCEIHDGIAQQLFGSQMAFQAAGQRLDEAPDEARENFDRGFRLLNNSLAEARRLISGLRPPILDELGIVTAVEYLIRETELHNELEIEFVHDVRSDHVAPPLQTTVFRIVQEGLTNAWRHSQSKKVRVELVEQHGRFRLEIRDWGVGFNPDSVEEKRFGLQGIRERAGLLGGQVTIDTALGKGTRIAVELPIMESSSSQSD